MIADFIERSMKQLGRDESIPQVQMAVDEACTNIIKYAYAESAGFIDISCELQGDDFVVTLRDKGKPFDPKSVPLPDLKADLDKRKIGGLGIFLMGQLMDDLSYSFDVKGGNKLVMRKKQTP